MEFSDAMKLEVERIRVKLSAADRDRALLSIGIDPATIDPNGLLDDTYMGKLCKVSNTLALLGHVLQEEKMTGSINLETTGEDIIYFWNINGIGEACADSMCEVRLEMASTQTPSKVTSKLVPPLLLVCSNCKRKMCRTCCAGRVAVLLGSYNNPRAVGSFDGSNHGGQRDGLSGNRSDGVICRSCCSEVVQDVLLLNYVKVLSSMRRRDRAEWAAYKAFDQVIRPIYKNSTVEGDVDKNWLRKLLNGDESLAEFPFAGLLYPVETANGSAPFLSLIAPFGSGEQHSYWRAPPSVSSVEFAIVLGSLSDVSGVLLIISPCGYSTSDVPTVQIWASNKINKEERSCIGKWDVQSMIASSSELYGQEKYGGNKDVPRHVKFTFRHPVRCRIIWISLSLRRPGSSSFNVDREFNLLSLDESDFSQLNRPASFSAAPKVDPCIHAKRLLVVGSSVRKELGPDVSLQESDKMNMRAWLERAPPLSRFKVQVEAERLTDYDRILEQYLLPGGPTLAGFRLDAFSAIKPRITHSPSLRANIGGDASLICIEDRNISPAVLFIQVSALQDSSNMVIVGEYRLPEAKSGTPLYFDFPRAIQARRVNFKLLGDLAAFADDPAEQDDSDFKTLPSSLSLSNRIKLYYYADPYELGKWANLYAV